jgi:hypothetical protein
MRQRLGVVFVLLLFLVLLSLALVGCGQDGGEKPVATVEPTASESETTLSGEQLLQDRCAECHNLGRVESARKTPEQWEKTLQRMVSKGTRLDEQEFAVLLGYLAENYK